jgi:hypothetical protein
VSNLQVTFLSGIREASISNLDRNTGYPDCFSGINLVPQEKQNYQDTADTVHLGKTHSFDISYSSFCISTRSLDAVCVYFGVLDSSRQ